MVLIVYTTAYRKGSDKFERVAKTMEKEIAERYSGAIQCIGIFGKKDLTTIFKSLESQNKKIDEFHFIGHAGMYGPMYGTVEYPEQYSPYELKTLSIPFSDSAKAYFHCCRSARWFAPFFARHFNVETFGYHWYTAFSSNKVYFKPVNKHSQSVYAAGCIGKKSHGITGSIKKYSGTLKLETMRGYTPEELKEDSSYNRVAALYDNVFQDIKVRKDEWKWLKSHLPNLSNYTVVDIGCGNGALLKELAPHIKKGIGLDASVNILDKARQMHTNNPNIHFDLLNGPSLPLEDNSVDVMISLLSFRYLDWDPLMDEIKRVLKPGSKILIIDMVTVPVKWHEFPAMFKAKIHQYIQRYQQPQFYKNLLQLVNDPDWKNMLKHNPIRSEHEMKWYLESRFPGKKIEKINIGWNASILAFDSGNIESIQNIKLSYP